MSVLEISGVSKRFSKNGRQIAALDGVSLAVEKGTFAAVRGPSGCGKSTLLLVAGGLLRPDAGTIQIDGKDLYSLNAEQRALIRARSIGFVFQEYHLIPYLTIRENILSPALSIFAQDQGRRADELLQRFALSERGHHLPSELSAGERQRAALARALLNRPELILADEPTGNLDEGNARIVLACLREFTGSGGSVVLVTHDERAARAADRTVRMEQGKIVVTH